MQIDVFTLVPEAFAWMCDRRPVAAVLGGELQLALYDYRDFTPLRGGEVDDTPYGGGAGMVLRVDVVDAALQAVYGDDRAGRRIVALTPAGRLLDQTLVEELAAAPRLTLLSARFEGFDARILEHLVTDTLSVGRYVLSGGEIAAMVVVDAIARLLPGALGSDASAVEETFSAALDRGAEYPHFTRPAEYRGWPVPAVLLSGDHARIEAWRLEMSRDRSLA